MPSNRNKNLSRAVKRPTEFAWIAVLLGGLLFLLFNFFWFFPTLDELDASAKEKQADIAHQAANSVDQFLLSQENALKSTAAAVALVKAALPVSQKDVLSDYIKSQPSVLEASIVSPEGLQEYRLSSLFDFTDPIFVDVSDTPEFIKAKETGLYASEFYTIGDPYDIPLLKMSVAIKQGDAFLGVLVAHIKLEEMWSLVSDIRVGRRGYVYIVNKNGSIIAHPQRAVLTDSLNVSDRGVVVNALSGQDVGSGEYVDEDRISVYATAVRLSHNGWVAVAQEPKADVFLAKNRLNSIAITGMFTGAALLVLLTWNSFSLTRTTRLLDRQRHQTSAIIRYLTDGLIQYDHGSKIMLMNPMAEQLLGVLRQDVVGMSIQPHDLRNPRLKTLVQVLYPVLSSSVRRVTHDPNEYPKIHEIRITDPIERDFQVATVPILDENGIATGFLKVIHDISRERLITRAKSEFISIAAHQLRTPLSGIKWTMKLLLDQDLGPITEKQKMFLSKGYETNERMIGLIRDLLDVARLEEGRFGFEFKEADLAHILQAVINEYQPNAQKKGISLELRLPPSESLPPVTVDAGKLTLAITNLVDNAVKYTSRGGVTVFVAVQKPFVEIRVKDSGIGVPKDQKLRLFSKFFRASNASRLQTEGSGLGLFIVRNIIRRHGGEIWFESAEGKGTTFILTLPLDARLIPNTDPLGSGSIEA